MKPHLTTTPDGEIVYDPPHEHHTVRRNGELAWCCSTRGTPAGRIGPLTRIPAGVGYERERELMKKLHRQKSKSAPEVPAMTAPVKGVYPPSQMANRPVAALNGADPTLSSKSFLQTSPSGPSAGGKMVGAGITEGASADSLTPQSGDTPSVPRLQTPSLKSMNGPSGKTANNAESETAPKETGSLADLVASGERVVGAREVTTSYGRTCILEGASGKEYWGTALLLAQLEEDPLLLEAGGDIVVEVRSANGRTYRTFSKAIKTKGRRFGKGAA